MLSMRVMCVEGAGWWLSGVETSPGTWCLNLLREAIWSTHVSLSHPLVSLGVALGGGWALVGLVVAVAALSVHPPGMRCPTRCCPESMRGTQIGLPPKGGL